FRGRAPPPADPRQRIAYGFWSSPGLFSSAMSERVDPLWRRPMVARDRDQPHRAATPLELLFDLCFVVAVAQAAAQLHHAVVEDHIGPAILGYLMVFFGIW